MEWTQFLILLVTIAGLFLWNRSESRSDYRHLEAGVNAQLNGIREEMKDFHGRLERQDAEFKSFIINKSNKDKEKK